ncbi:MAG TPA: hypothetical protein VF190_11900 [Rhodothermales bacterium]
MHPTKRAFTLLAALVLLATTGCEETVDPIIGTDLPFTIWGFMNAGADTQRVRVYPITGELQPDGSAGIDARVYSIDLDTGERREWTYKQVRFDSLTVGHVFWSPFRAVHGRRYRLEVIRSDGATSSTEVVVPPPVSFRVEIVEGRTEIPVEIDGNVPNLIGFHVTYHAQSIPPANVWGGGPIPPPVDHSITLPYDHLLRAVPGGWEVTIDMQDDYETLRALYRLACLVTDEGGSAPDLWLNRMEITAVAVDSSWSPPGGVFDPDVLAIPGTFSNVENGYGFFGAGHGLRHAWTPSIVSRQAAGFNFQPKCNFTAQPDLPECQTPPDPCIGEEVRNLWDIYLD